MALSAPGEWVDLNGDATDPMGSGSNVGSQSRARSRHRHTTERRRPPPAADLAARQRQGRPAIAR
jgi:hypothetical protein